VRSRFFALAALAAVAVAGTAAAASRFDGRPDARFASARQGWTVEGATDTGVGGAWRVVLDRPDPRLLSPTTVFPASRVRTLYVRARWASPKPVARVYWSRGGSFATARSRAFFPAADGYFHTYAIRLAGIRGYSGTITRLRLDPVESPRPGDFVDVACISWRPCGADGAAETLLQQSVPLPRFLDPMEPAPSRLVWQADREGLVSTCRIGASYDVEVAYSGSATLSIGDAVASSPSTAATGALRLTRAGNSVDIWVRTPDRAGWTPVARGRFDAGRPELVRVTGDVSDFRVTRGEFSC